MAPRKFKLFPKLPPELRDRIWYHVTNQDRRTIDVWTDFKQCEIDNTTFYTQFYDCPLSNRPPPSIFRVCIESRKVALQQFTLEFATCMTLPNRISVTTPGNIYVNYETDTLVPRGYWNILSFGHFFGRVGGRLGCLAVDVNGNFWTDNMRDYCKKRVWLFPGLDELILYDSNEETVLKDSEHLDKWKKRYRGGPKDLGFMDLSFGDSERVDGWTKDLTQKLTDCQMFMQKMFDKIEGKVVDEVVYDEDGVPIEKDEESLHSARYLKNYDATTAQEFQRPRLKLARLVVKEPTVVPIW